ncbi:unnamed protein product [Caenorhabditis bovis]|uniref:ShKT domain-containing protein n=1 Tax=Caenorhabditis bovis TaxID=2654633 RepID=A0A8S1F2U3_9PELO|nr:unnamed protein product [Caenorhabditis bovis]
MRFLIICSSILAIASCQQCANNNFQGPCDDTMPCPTGQFCIASEGSCCLDSDAVQTTAAGGATGATGATGSTQSNGGATTPRTTGSSGTCVDLLNPSTGVSDCPRRANLCNDAQYYDIMTRQCPRTCGRCGSQGGSTTRSTATCVDLVNPRTGVSDCPGMSSYCTNSLYREVMRVQCPRTCNLCGSATGATGATTRSGTATTRSSGTCVDKVNPRTGVSDCPRSASLCNDSRYATLMRTECPRTCGFC